VIKPAFYENIAEMTGIEMTQGQFFIDRAQYNKDDQFICMVEGSAHLRMVPHINWNSMYTGENIK